jgi:hypothetical protein
MIVICFYGAAASRIYPLAFVSQLQAPPGPELQRQRQRNQKYDALKYYQLNKGNLLYRQPSDGDSPRQVVTGGEIFDSIKQELIEINHTCVNKTYQAL